MWTSDRRGQATLALIALAGLALVASIDARGAVSCQRYEQRPSERQRQGARPDPAARQNRRSYAARAEGVRAGARRQESHARDYPVAAHRPRTLARGGNERTPAAGNVMREGNRTGSRGAREFSGESAGSQVRVVRYGNTLSGTVERPIRPGFVSRSFFVNGGHVLYTRVYQQHVWHQFGRTFAYERFVPAVRFPAVYYGWALGAWPRPIVYAWGWQAQPWYPMYGALFTPYPVYASPDLWMTDYILAQNMQAAYEAQPVAPAATAAAADSSYGAPTAQPTSPPPPQATYPAPPPQASDGSPAPQPTDAPPAPAGPPPAVTPRIKAQLDAEIKVQLQEQQAAAAMPVSLTSQSTSQSAPPALRPNHVFFQVVQPLQVPSGTADGYCSLSPDDYIKRTGTMSSDDWMIPVVVELSGPSDCPQGLHTRIGLNDLNAMENEQEAQVMEAMQAASRSMGPNGPPSGGPQPTLITAGTAAPDAGALEAVRQAQ